MTNFEKRWAWFFTLAGWQWKYFPAGHGYRVQPSFRVCIPCANSECNGSHVLDVFLRRGVTRTDQFAITVHELASQREGGDNAYSDPHPALFGENPSATVWEMPHGSGGGEYHVESWVPDWERLWSQARCITCVVATPPVGRLR